MAAQYNTCPDCKTASPLTEPRCLQCGYEFHRVNAPLVAVPMAPQIQLVAPESQTKECPFCAETIKAAAIKCRFCGSELEAVPVQKALSPAAFDIPTAPVRTQSQSSMSGVGVQEVVYLQNSDVTITASRAILRGKTYAMANVTSVSYFKQNADKSGATVLCIFSLLMIIVCFASDAYPLAAFGVLLLIISILWINSLKPKFWVRIGSASSEGNALWAHDENYIREIVDAMNKAIVLRG